ncbi:RHS repeat-associated core domain-containing protein [Flavobacterium sp. FlaQc-47]|uniref:RHS repeat-associated core domain-containing protein n=1 Tax=Flavobacterium sp. FlaQc-47 TaxID=3374180 RepID=UPI003757117D
MKQFYFLLIFFSLSLSVNAQSLTGSSTEVGISDGQLSVSLSGAANYTVPIAVPQGINGVEPKINLQYSSQGGNGVAGYGWNIGGVSGITRIASSKFHDGVIDPVDFDSLDRFALDGQRLILKTGVYGADGAEYQTENFSNLKITSHGVSDGSNYGPQYFKVEYPDGSISFYGNDTGSKSILSWSISTWENSKGVRVNYYYTTYNNVLNISSIKYGSLLDGNPPNEIQFFYGSKKRLEQSYIAGHSILMHNLLTSIKIFTNSIGYRNYTFTYDETYRDYQRLINITEKSGDNSKNYNPTIFTYGDLTNTSSVNLTPATLDLNNIDSEKMGSVSGDFDGDGNPDIILYPKTTTDAKKKYWLYKNILASESVVNTGLLQNSGAFEEIFPSTILKGNAATGLKLETRQGWTVVKYDKTSDLATFSVNSSPTSAFTELDYEKVFQFSKFKRYYFYNCDGADPLRVGSQARSDSTLNTSSLKEGVVEKDIPKIYISGDFNGDALTDIVVIEKPFIYHIYKDCGLTTPQTYAGGVSYFVNLDKRISSNFVDRSGILTVTENSKYYVADFDGDGISDLYVFDTGYIKVYSLNQSNQFALIFENPTVDSSIVLDKQILLGDFNGDGKTDFVIPTALDQDSWIFYISTGLNFGKIIGPIGIKYNQSQIKHYDDVTVNNNSWVKSLNENTFVALDINGDGKTDILNQQNFTVESDDTGTANNRPKGMPQMTRFQIALNMSSTTNIIKFLPTVNFNFSNNIVNRFPIAIFANLDDGNKSPKYSLISGNKIYSFYTPYNKFDVLLNKITTGNGVAQIITYKPLDTASQQGQYPVYYNRSYTENYPNVDILNDPNFLVVSMIEKKSATSYKKKLFQYYGAVSNVEGLGFLGFRGTMQTNWFDDDSVGSVVSNVSKFDINRRGANSDNYSALGILSPVSVVPTTYISKSEIKYNLPEDALLSNKVYKLKTNSSEEFNGLTGTSTKTETEYNDYNNPLKIITIAKEGQSAIQTNVIDLTYYDIPASYYMVDRPKRKTVKATLGSEVMNSEELYYYNEDELLSKVEKKGEAFTNYIVQDISYDSFGNIKKKILTAGGDSRETSLEYDPTGRYLIKSIDVENLATTFIYNPNGTLKSKTNPFLQTTVYEYDSWFKKTKETDYLGYYITYNYENSRGNTIIRKIGSDESVEVENFDDLGRKTRTGVRNIMGTYTYISYLYDIHDRTYKVSEPHIGVDTTPTEWNESQYDEYGRLSKSIDFKGKTTEISNPPGLTSTVTDGTKNETYVKNALGKVVSMSDAPSNTINYTYYPNGNLSKINYGGLETTILQDGWGRKKQLKDPSAGIFKYTYNDFGDLTIEENPNGITTYNLTPLGKLDTKTVYGGNGTTNSKTIYSYDSDKLLIKTEYKDLANGTNIITDFKYDASRRISTKTETTQYAKFIKRYKYDALGRLEYENSTAKIGNATSSNTIRNTYRYGVHYQILDSITNNVVWQTNEVNSRGQLLSAQSGPTTVTNNYDKALASKLKYDRTTYSNNILTLDYTYDSRENLKTSSNSMFEWDESFDYDSKDRLTKFNNDKGIQETQGYDDKGRITQNSLGIYNYNIQDKPYQNSSVTIEPEAKTYYENRGRIYFDDMESQRGWSPDYDNQFNYEGVSYNGQKALKLSTSADDYQNNAKAHKLVQIDNAVDTQYTFSGWVNTNNPKAQITLLEYESDDPFPFKSEVVSTETKAGWVYLEKNVLVPKNIKQLQLELNAIATPTTIGYASFDDVQIAKTSAVSAQKELNITYNTFKSPVRIEELGVEILDFGYNDDNQRSTMYYGGIQSERLERPLRKHYSADGTMEIKENRATGTYDFVSYIGGDGYSAPAVVKSDGITQNYLYLQRDNLGSIVVITSADGATIETRLYDAWGSIISIGGGTTGTLDKLTILDRGYTGHEHIQSVGLINMNGRLYDPKLRRFLQPDNNVQDPFNSQNYNRYAYVLNNPLKYTDQTGEFWQYIAYFLAAYIQGGAASGGELNPLKWNGNTWMSVFSAAGTVYATGAANTYIEKYNNKPPLGASATSPGIDNKYIRSYNSNEGASLSRYNYSSFAYAGVVSVGLVADDVTVIGVADDVLIPVAWGTAATVFVWDNREVIKDDAREIVDAIHRSLDPSDFHYVTYTKTSLDGKLVYVGRSSGYGTPESIVKRRDIDHHIKGYGTAELSSSLPATIVGGYGARIDDPAYWAIRGSEQIQIENWRKKGMSGNGINGISPTNQFINKYLRYGIELLY